MDPFPGHAESGVFRVYLLCSDHHVITQSIDCIYCMVKQAYNLQTHFKLLSLCDSSSVRYTWIQVIIEVFTDISICAFCNIYI